MTTIDNTAPEIEDVSVSLVDGSLTSQRRDNEYVSVVALYDAVSSKALTYVAPNQETAGETQHVPSGCEQGRRQDVPAAGL